MNIISGNKAVTSAATPLQITSTVGTFVKKLIITPFSGNTGVVAVGGSAATTVAAVAIGSQKGWNAVKGANPLELYDVDLSQIWVDASVNGEGISYVAEY